MTRKQHSPDIWILCISIFCAVFGLVMVYSSSAYLAAERYGDSLFFLKKQLIWVIVGMTVLSLLMCIEYSFWQRHAYVIIGGTLVLLVAVLLHGRSVGGAQRWIRFGPFNIQPSELAKLTVIIGLADFLDRKRSRMGSFWKGYFPPLTFVSVVCGLILMEPDLGTSLIIFSVCLSLLYLGAAKIRFLVGTVCALLPILYGAVWLVPYRKERILSFLDPWADRQGSGYQIVQSLTAIGSGGFQGKGLGQSEAKLLYIPEPHTDFIFSIIGEELGLVGAVFFIGLFTLFAVRGIMVARRSPDLFGSFLAAGITLTIVYQALINIAVVSGCLPTKGLPLPFLSFGGSSLIFTMAGVGMLLNVSRYAKKKASV